MNIKITKQLTRPDLGVILENSIANCNPITVEATKIIMFPINLFTSQTAQDEKAPKVYQCTEFPKMRLIKECSDIEWNKLNDDAGAGALMTGWFKSAIDDIIGLGNTQNV